ncbi:ABC transporter permease [Nesterenkonia pannonica]|uniref:ABC transporter permease n=1 Tax=Nesterenkonia pannonica TaxID=1548602 RepID=UPI0021641848|nr:ABC transporter permease [Nesterenkonia pannonica]
MAPETSSRRRPTSGRSWGSPVLGLTGILAFLAIWELFPRLGLADSRYLPPASEVLMTAAGNLADLGFWASVGVTMQAWAIGLFIATAVSTILGLVIGMSSFLRRYTHSTIEFLRPIPSVALIPLAVLLFGIGLDSALLLIVYACFWQVLIQVLYGVGDIDTVAMNTAQSYRFSYWQRIRDVVIPTMLPYLMTGLRLAAAVALILAITAGLVIGTPGLGSDIALSQQGGAITNMYALILATGALGVVINFGARLVERRVLSWHTSVRGELAS